MSQLLAPEALAKKPRKHDGVFSATQVLKAYACLTAWSLNSLHKRGVFKQRRGTVLGTLIHECMEGFFRGGTVFDAMKKPSRRSEKDIASLLRDVEPGKRQGKRKELLAEAPQRALSGVHLLPHPSECEVVQVERNLTHIPSFEGVTPTKWRGALDLTIKANGRWLLVDHKSTKGKQEPGVPYDYWCFIPEDLTQDLAANLYACSVMLELGLTELDCRWVYYSTAPKKAPIAKAVDFHITLEAALAFLHPWMKFAAYLQTWVDWSNNNEPPPLDAFPKPLLLKPDPESPCSGYGGCEFHTDSGGICQPEGAMTLAQTLGL